MKQDAFELAQAALALQYVAKDETPTAPDLAVVKALSLGAALSGDEQAQTIAGLLAVITDLVFMTAPATSASRNAKKVLDLGRGVAYGAHLNAIEDEKGR